MFVLGFMKFVPWMVSMCFSFIDVSTLRGLEWAVGKHQSNLNVSELLHHRWCFFLLPIWSLTVKAPGKLPKPKRKGSSSNHHGFQGRAFKLRGCSLLIKTTDNYYQITTYQLVIRNSSRVHLNGKYNKDTFWKKKWYGCGCPSCLTPCYL